VIISKNFRVQDLPIFMSHLTERALVSRFIGYLEAHGLLPWLQSVNLRHDCTETAMLKVRSDIFAAIDGDRLH
jgi:hypothetical protein